mgnify:CR=1 FL=1
MADTVLTLLEPGEYVLNKNAVDAVGKENLDELNYEDAPRFPEGSIMADYASNQMGMQTGGSISYGGYESEEPSLNSLYEMFGVMPKKPERFQDYDPTREGVYEKDYERALDKYATGAENLLGQVYDKTASQGGFSSSGRAEATQQQARKSIMDDYLQSQEAAYSTMFKGVRDERERFLRETGAQLSALEQAEGTRTYQGENSNVNIPPSDFDPNTGGWNPPQNPSTGTEYTAPNGQVYVYTERDGWMTAEDYRSNYDMNDRM